jgi:NAD(P)-dependent dehydrogenase (short-subunit alcohol dehydrogenase family)
MPNVLITGTNRGIGLELCKQFTEKKGFHLFACCRSKSADLEKLPVTLIENIDVTSSEAGSLIKKTLGKEKIDILIHNAGIYLRDSFGKLTAKDLEKQFQTNSIAPILLSQELFEHLAPKAKIIFISSSAGSIAQKTNSKSYGYRASKCALNMMGRLFAYHCEDKQMPVLLIHPGYVKTDMTGHNGNISPETSAEGIIHLIDQLTMDQSGSFVAYDGSSMPW